MSSLLEQVAELDDNDYDRFISGLTPAQLTYLMSWEAMLRPAQRPEEDVAARSWSVAIACAGRGWGKTLSGAVWVKERVLAGARSIVLVGPNANEINNVMIRGESGILAAFPGCRYVPSHRKLYFPGGAVATTYTGEAPQAIRGENVDTIWIDELAAMQYPMEVLMQCRLIARSRRAKLPIKIYVTTTPIGNEATRCLVLGNDTDEWPGARCSCVERTPDCSPLPFADPHRFKLVHGHSQENFTNLDEFAREYYTALSKTRMGQQEVFGRLLLDTPGALWSADLLDRTRVSTPPEKPLKRIVVVDPAVSTNEGSDLTGLVVIYAATGPATWGDNRSTLHAFVVADHSGRYTGEQLSAKINQINLEHGLSYALYEENQGGMYIKGAIAARNPTLQILGVRAVSDKAARANITATNTELGLIHIVGHLPQLEQQLTSWSADPNAKKQRSPDRLDAMVHGCNTLVPIQRQRLMMGLPGTT